MITKQHWFGALAIAFSVHVAAFISLPVTEDVNTAKDHGEAGIEVDLGMLGDLGVAMAETVNEKVEQQLDPEPIEEPITEPVESVEVEQQSKPEPIIKPIEVEQKPIVKKDIVKIKKQQPQIKKIKKEAQKKPVKIKPKVEVTHQPKKSSEPVTAKKAKKTNVEAKKISTGSQNTVSTGGNKGADRSYISVISAKLARYKRYPKSARKKEHEGTVTLFFIVKRDGKVIESYISQSSGYPQLDRAVLRMLKKASPLPRFPENMEQEQLSIRIPIEFKLNDKR